MNSEPLVAKVWNFAHVLRDRGVSYQAYISQISYLLFLKMDEERLRTIAEARAKIEASARERHAREMAGHETKMAARAAKTAATDKKPGGRPPQPPPEGPLPSDQVNLTRRRSPRQRGKAVRRPAARTQSDRLLGIFLERP